MGFFQVTAIMITLLKSGYSFALTSSASTVLGLTNRYFTRLLSSTSSDKHEQQLLWKTPRVYIASENIQLGSQLQLDEDTSHYIFNVMRVKTGENVRVFNGMQGEFLAQVCSFTKKKMLTIEIQKETRCRMESAGRSSISIIFSPIKKPRLKIMFEKAVEIGVTSLLPLITCRTQGPYESSDSLRKTIIESCEQSERITVPLLRYRTL